MTKETFGCTNAELERIIDMGAPAEYDCPTSERSKAMRQHEFAITLSLLLCALSASSQNKPWKTGTVTVVVNVDPPDHTRRAFFQSHSYEIGNGTDIYCSRGDEYHAPDCTTPPASHDTTSYDITRATIEVEDGTLSYDPFPKFDKPLLALFVEKWEATREWRASGQTRSPNSRGEPLAPPEQRSTAFPPCTSGPCLFEYKGVFVYQLGKRHRGGIQDITIAFADELGTEKIHANYHDARPSHKK